MQHRQSCPVRDKIMQRYDQELLGVPLWCTTQQKEGLWIQGANVMVLQRRVFVCTSELALDESLSHQHMGVVYHRGRSPNENLGYQYMRAVYHRGSSQIVSTNESHGGDMIILRWWTRRSITVPQRWIYRSRRKGCICKSTDSRAMGLATPWYRRGGTFVKSLIPFSHGGRALVVKGAEEVENAKANSKYPNKAEGQRSRNFIRPMSMGFSSR
ncbi:hypothetical protein B296_00032291 [Ensete ventricosum]|uniref:Uncharacterized protein n=1 Tax=Ensete ventricosum TaxID=4639 RepID=A0A426WZJ5_ENSVE|nr:hypothetical protein B296_00032291 [Ensete ventricosum]